MPLSDKRFVLVSNQVNNYGYRVDTAGMDITQYEKNPILLFMHNRAFGSSKDQILALGHMQELVREANGDITGRPYFSDNDEFAMQVYHKVTDGTYRMCSVGFEAIETSDDISQLMPGQRYATVTKSKLKEVSIVDIGADDNALCLYANGSLLRLDDSKKTSNIIPLINNNKNRTMTQNITPMLLLVGLPAEGTMEQLVQKVTELKQASEKASSDLVKANEQIVALNDTIGALEQAAKENELDGLLQLAIDARKITKEQQPIYKKMGQASIDTLRSLFETMPTMPSLQSQLSAGSAAGDPLLKLTYEEAHKSGKLMAIKTNHPEYYKQIFKDKYGKEPRS
jgi:hypothetical protein